MTYAIHLAARDALAALDRFHEAITRKQIDRTLAPIDRTLEAQLAVLFTKQGARVVRRLVKYRRDFLRESIKDDFDDVFDAAIEPTSIEMQAAITAATENALIAGANALARDIRWDRVFSLTNPRAIAYIRDNAANAIASIDSTTRDTIRTIILAGIENGTSYTAVARQIRTQYAQFGAKAPQAHIRNRAELIAVTETGNAYQTGNYLQALDINKAGVKLEKMWQTVGDKRVSAGCRDNEAQGYINVDDDHGSGHPHPLRFPGCRCVEVYRRKQ